MLKHSFVLDALDTTGADTFSHFEMLIDEHRSLEESEDPQPPSRLRQLVPTVGNFFTRLPLRRAFLAYNAKYRVTKRRHVCISFNEIRHILNLAQIMALSGEANREELALGRWEASPLVLSTSPLEIPPELSLSLDQTIAEEADEDSDKHLATVSFAENHLSIDKNPEELLGQLKSPSMITFDGDQTLYSDGANFESNPLLANYLYLLLCHGVNIAVVTAAGYEYKAEKYEFRLSGLLSYFKERKLHSEHCERFYLFGGECNYLLRLGSDYKLHPVKEYGPGGWKTATLHMSETPGNWDEASTQSLLDKAEASMQTSMNEQNLRARIIRKKRGVGLIPKPNEQISREALDEAVLRVQSELVQDCVELPFCAFNGGRDAWVDVGNKRVGVQVLQSYLGVVAAEMLHIGDQFLNTGNDYAARGVCPCVWITDPEETTYILKLILRLANVSLEGTDDSPRLDSPRNDERDISGKPVNYEEATRRTEMVQLMDVFTGEMISAPPAIAAPHKSTKK